jgi:hypothetical protein
MNLANSADSFWALTHLFDPQNEKNKKTLMSKPGEKGGLIFRNIEKQDQVLVKESKKYPDNFLLQHIPSDDGSLTVIRCVRIPNNLAPFLPTVKDYYLQKDQTA